MSLSSSSPLSSFHDAAPVPVIVNFDEGGVTSTRPTGVNCPSCHDELVIGDIRKCQFAGCPSCGGMLFKQEVFGMLIQHLRSEKPNPAFMPKPLNFDELSVRRLCPSCHGTMETHAYAGPGNSVIDTCFPCRLIFLDKGELTKLAEAPGKR